MTIQEAIQVRHSVLLAQTLGLNSCWVGLTFRKLYYIKEQPLAYINYFYYLCANIDAN